MKAGLDARLAVLDTHLKAATETMKRPSRPLPAGTRPAKDGQHYVADTQRPGKFLKVVHHGG